MGQFSPGSSSPAESELSEGDKEELKEASQKWSKHKTGNIYWLDSDLTVVLDVARVAIPRVVKHYIRHTYWHANQLARGEPIEWHFAQLCKKVKLFTPEDWNNPDLREEVSNELIALFHKIAFVMEG